MRLLLIENDASMAMFVKRGFSLAGYAVDHADNITDGLFMVKNAPYRIIISDAMLLNSDETFIEQLLDLAAAIPIIVLSSKNDLSENCKDLYSKVDEVLGKPFEFSALLEKTQKLLQKRQVFTEQTTLSIDDIHLDILKRRVLRDNKEIKLQPREFSLLAYLMCNAGRIVTKDMVLKHAWNLSKGNTTNTVEVRICKLRDKLDRNLSKKFVHTVRGFGYVFEAREE